MDQPNLSPLHELHLTNSAKFIEFAGWTMPFSYSGTIKEHNYVRNDVGYFDVSHMGRLKIDNDSIESLSSLICSDIKNLKHCLLYTSPSPRDRQKSRMPSSA